MEIQYVSDLHGNINQVLPVRGDTLVLAGDIAVGVKGLEYAIKHANLFKHVFYLPGNHEYYDSSIASIDSALRNISLPSNVHLLDKKVVEINGYVFYGETMWSNILNEEEYQILNSLNDFRYIDDLTVSSYNNRYRAAYARISKICREYIDKKLVLVTHHLPSYTCVHSKYRNSPINSAFASNILEDLTKQAIEPGLWIHGHTHDSVEVARGRCIILCNPQGYRSYFGNENYYFNKGKTIKC